MKKENVRTYIREWRKKRGLTQTTLAERMESSPGVKIMSYATVSNIERGEQSPTLEQLNAIAEALDVTVTDLIDVNPEKDGEVVDLLNKINDKNREQVIALLSAVIG